MCALLLSGYRRQSEKGDQDSYHVLVGSMTAVSSLIGRGSLSGIDEYSWDMVEMSEGIKPELANRVQCSVGVRAL